MGPWLRGVRLSKSEYRWKAEVEAGGSLKLSFSARIEIEITAELRRAGLRRWTREEEEAFAAGWKVAAAIRSPQPNACEKVSNDVNESRWLVFNHVYQYWNEVVE